MPQFKRIMLKLSGEVLLGDKQMGIDFEVLNNLSKQIAEVVKTGVQVAIVLGAGNIWRYRDNTGTGLDRVTSDNLGMLATIMNGVAMQHALEVNGIDTRVCSAISMPQLVQDYVVRQARIHLDRGKVVILVGGIGNPYFTTDSAAALRALELNCNVLLKATKVDGVYDKDPMEFADAQRFEKMTYTDVLSKDLKFMDATSVALCRDGNLPILLFDLNKEGNIMKAATGQKIGTMITL
ncbi:MAG: uridylate kinase, uridylate kinase [Candidatus Peregrinibacteria bacterium GW2011_GWF2_33_10]|nr:MAG: uridylate kinase, uridylate kinase [Candidatus Peregrinibacteria bacterium GW2011_GWF2_33_10]OGJ45143.1 MAG: UMP kinase [Candidatus Peregrinibacteria bacterium RIFOXYA2_FULL_33_21]OGJ46328.1 MAG: UMP kinase [Candidatus Peregrinibacteria bacterium RIFOXYA12_FULL_33_12]OGJ50812.1 MAG: UMP kinase [Candidatus Peregrinibacteria bacterium RIFOXYB2_FULL_33_20]